MVKIKMDNVVKNSKFDPAKTPVEPGVYMKAIKIDNAAVWQLGSYANSSGSGCFAMMSYADPPKPPSLTASFHMFIVYTSEHRLQTMLEMAMARQETVYIICAKPKNPPTGPWLNVWEKSSYGDVYRLIQVLTHHSGLLGGTNPED